MGEGRGREMQRLREELAQARRQRKDAQRGERTLLASAAYRSPLIVLLSTVCENGTYT